MGLYLKLLNNEKDLLDMLTCTLHFWHMLQFCLFMHLFPVMKHSDSKWNETATCSNYLKLQDEFEEFEEPDWAPGPQHGFFEASRVFLSRGVTRVIHQNDLNRKTFLQKGSFLRWPRRLTREDVICMRLTLPWTRGPGLSRTKETPAPGTSEAKQWEEDWDDAGWDDEDQDRLLFWPWWRLWWFVFVCDDASYINV